MQIKIVKYDTNMKLDWDSFVLNSKSPMFMFERNYMDYHSDRFKDHSLVFFKDDEIVAVLPCSEHADELRSHGGLTYGGMISSESMRQNIMLMCFDSLREYCVLNGIKRIVYKTIPDIYHKQPSEEDLYALFTSKATVEKVEASTVINLKNPLKLSKLRKRQINKALRENVYVEIDDSLETYIEFMRIQDSILKERHNVNAVHTGEEINLLHKRFPDSIHLYSAKINNKLLGGSIIFIYDNVIHTQYLCANEEARSIGALDLTISRIIDEFRFSKDWLDFGISTENRGLYLNEGLIGQKEGFGGRTKVYNTWTISFQ